MFVCRICRSGSGGAGAILSTDLRIRCAPLAGSRKKTILWRSIADANVSGCSTSRSTRFSAVLYLDFVTTAPPSGLDGTRTVPNLQAQEERRSTMLFYQCFTDNSEGRYSRGYRKAEVGTRRPRVAESAGARSWSPPASMPSTPPHTRQKDFRRTDAGLVHQGTGRGEERRR